MSHIGIYPGKGGLFKPLPLTLALSSGNNRSPYRSPYAMFNLRSMMKVPFKKQSDRKNLPRLRLQ
jgi:hypothetical protein